MKDKELRGTVAALKDTVRDLSSELRKDGFLEYDLSYHYLIPLTAYQRVQKKLDQDIPELTQKLNMLIEYLGLEIEETPAHTRFVKVKSK